MSALLGDKKKYADKAAKAQELNDLGLAHSRRSCRENSRRSSKRNTEMTAVSS
jgi:hypothetical protein